MRLSEMFVDQDVETFEQRRDEVLALISSATDLAGPDQDLRSIVERIGSATDESEFDAAFDKLVSTICETAPLHIRAA
jgi:hypothetical protein